MSDESIRVLLIEDNPGDARLIQETLIGVRETRFDLEHADRLSTGLERLAAGGIDVVLLDLGLPDSLGFDTFIKVHDQAPHVPILLLTGLEDDDLGVKAVREGAQDYLVKGQMGSSLLARAIRYAIERKQAEELIRQLAYHDALTGLPNRRLFHDRLHLEMAHSRRNEHKVGVMLLDLDDFKEVNDTLGHSVGDMLLQAVSRRLKELLRESDTVARMGGDEFMLILPEIGEAEDAAAVAVKVLEAFNKPFKLDHHEIRITTSVGIALYPDHGEDGDALMRNADIAMYRAKDLGRDNYQCFR